MLKYLLIGLSVYFVLALFRWKDIVKAKKKHIILGFFITIILWPLAVVNYFKKFITKLKKEIK